MAKKIRKTKRSPLDNVRFIRSDDYDLINNLIARHGIKLYCTISTVYIAIDFLYLEVRDLFTFGYERWNEVEL